MEDSQRSLSRNSTLDNGGMRDEAERWASLESALFLCAFCEFTPME